MPVLADQQRGGGPAWIGGWGAAGVRRQGAAPALSRPDFEMATTEANPNPPAPAQARQHSTKQVVGQVIDRRHGEVVGLLLLPPPLPRHWLQLNPAPAQPRLPAAALWGVLVHKQRLDRAHAWLAAGARSQWVALLALRTEC